MGAGSWLRSYNFPVTARSLHKEAHDIKGGVTKNATIAQLPHYRAWMNTDLDG